MNDSILRSLRVENGIFWFDLEETIVLEILQQRDAQAFGSANALIFPRSILKWLHKQSFEGLKSGINFITRYNSVAVFQTIVNLDGDIINKIQADILQRDDCISIGIAHFWLIDQLLLALRQQPNPVVIFITWTIIAFPIVVTVGVSVGDGMLNFPEVISIAMASGGTRGMYALRDRVEPQVQRQVQRWGWAFVRWQMGRRTINLRRGRRG